MKEGDVVVVKDGDEFEVVPREKNALVARIAAMMQAFAPIQQAITRHIVQMLPDRNPWSRKRGRAGPPGFIARAIREKFERRREARNRMARESRRKNRGAYRGR